MSARPQQPPPELADRARRAVELVRQPAHPAGRRARAARRLGRALGFHVVPRHFYSPIPNLDELPVEIFGSRGDVPGIEMDSDRCFALLESSLQPYVAEFPETGPPGFDLANGGYEAVDAEMLYALVRHHKPRRIIEIGTGFSTLVSSAAAKRNASEGSPLKFISVDPNPSNNTTQALDSALDVEQRPVPVQQVPIEDFVALEAGDILFVDGTHVVTTGGDVNFVVLEVLPRLRPGVLVHFHDIYLPYEYPLYFVERFFWTEQYLLQAFLALNPAFQVHMANHHLARSHPDRLARSIPSFNPQRLPSGFWLQRS